MRWLGVAALGAVIAQGVLGGLTVLFFLPAAISTAHAGLAEIFFCLTVAIALFTSPRLDRGGDVAAASTTRRCGGSRRRRPSLDLHADPRRRDDAAHGRRPGDSRLPADVRPPRAGPLGSEDRDPLRASRRRARRDAARSSRPSAHVLVAPPRPARADAAGDAAARAGRGAGHARRAHGAEPRATSWINSVHVVCGALVLTTSLVLTLRSWRVTLRESRHGPTQSRATPTTSADVGLAIVRGVRRSDGRSRSARVKDAPRRRRDAAARRRAARRRALADYVALTKPRLNFLVVATSAAGYYLGAPGALDLVRDGAGGRRHGARRRRRRGAQSGLRARHRRADAAHAHAPAAGRPRRRRPTRGIFGLGAVARPASRCSRRAPTCSPPRSRSRRSSSTSSSTRR